MLFAFIGFVSIVSPDPPTENEAPDTKVAQPIVQPQAEPVPVAATPPVKEQAPQLDMETETSGIIIASAVNVEELSCPEPVSVKLEYNKAVPVRRIASDAVEQCGGPAAENDENIAEAARANNFSNFATYLDRMLDELFIARMEVTNRFACPNRLGT